MTVRAKDVLDSETLKMVGSVHNQQWYQNHMAAKRQAARSRREIWEDAARHRFPNRPDWEAFDLQREWDEEHQ